jgi:hypothetical protein
MARQQINQKQLPLMPVKRRSMLQDGSSLEPLKLHTMERKIRHLERVLAQREQEVWTLKQLLLYH